MAAKPKAMAGFLPPEIWREILTRLPTKSILRCRSVCKSWYSLISSPNFISNYSVTNLNKNGSRLLLQLYDDDDDDRLEFCSFSTFDKSFMESCEHDYVPEPFLGRYGRIIGSCNGLICLSEFDPAWAIEDSRDVSAINFLIWNPSIRKVVELPPRNFRSHTQYPSFIGFGFDSKTNDYKVLCVVATSPGLGEENGDFSAAHVCEIFDLSKGVWRVISPLVGSSWCVGGPHQDYYLNGAVHWSGYRHRHAKSSDGVIFSFNMSDEIFREIRMPNGAEFIDNGDHGDSHIETRTVTFNGLIHVIVYKAGKYGYIDVLESCSVWTMKEYGLTESWTKVFNIDLRSAQGLPSTCLWPNHFRLWDNGEVLMVHGLSGDEDIRRKQDLVLYNAGSRKCKLLLSLTKCVSTLCLYEESLILM